MVVDLSKTERQTDPLIGRKLDGRYEVLARLGEGGVGVVYRGRQTQLGRFVAIKVLQQDAAAIPEWRLRFEREAKALSALAHPNVVPVTDFGIDGGVPFLVMELLQGQTLGQLIKEGPVPLWRALDIIRQTLRGLAFAHGKGIVHRDLKPANVFLQELPDQDDHVRLLDFGMAKFLDGSSARGPATDTLTRAGVAFGTPAYMSPEQAKGGPADTRTDVYAAGALLFELLAGRRPFVQDTPEGVVIAHLTETVPSLAKTRPGLTAAPLFQPVVERAMAKKPSARFKDAAAMLAALEAVVEKLPAEAVSGGRRKTTTRGRRALASRSARGRRALVLLTLGAGIAAAGTYLWVDRVTRGAHFTLPKAPSPKSLAKNASKPVTEPTPKAIAETTPTVAKAETAPKPAAPASAPRAAPAPSPPSKAEAATAVPSLVRAPAAAQEQEPPERLPPAPQAEGERQPRPRARNPWRAPVPRALRPIRTQLEHGVHPSQRALRPVYDFAKQNPSDPRPWLLLGRAYAQLDWFSDSVDRYVRADRVDSSCRGDPQMLADLLNAAAHPTAGRNAAKVVRDIYGAEAIPALDKVMERRAGEHEAMARLTRLRESLQH